MNFLGAILEKTRQDLERRKKDHPAELLRERPLYGRTPVSLRAALRSNAPAVIAEIKQASPSRGVICRDFDPPRIARQYESAGAAAISVLTQEDYFRGSLSDLEAVRHTTTLPLLRKDFVVDRYQVHEAKAAGADAVLLIAAALGPGEIATLQEEAGSLGMEALIEVHSLRELQSLGGLSAPLIGINNRDLVSFRTDLSVSSTLAPLLPPGSLGVSESGIRTGADIARLLSAGINAFLIGEQCMSADDPGKALRELLRRVEA
jgi:indole-3-glycerol phosphate synthase